MRQCDSRLRMILVAFVRRGCGLQTALCPPALAAHFRREQEPGMPPPSLIHRIAPRAPTVPPRLCWLAVLLVSLPLAAFAATDAADDGIAAIDRRSEV